MTINSRKIYDIRHPDKLNLIENPTEKVPGYDIPPSSEGIGLYSAWDTKEQVIRSTYSIKPSLKCNCGYGKQILIHIIEESSTNLVSFAW